jgi:hypothetical protein
MNMKTVMADPRARRYSDVLNDPQAPNAELVSCIDGAGDQMAFVTTHLGLPAYSAFVRPFEQTNKAKQYYSQKKGPSRFNRFAGIVVMIKMEEMQFTRTGRKGSLRPFSDHVSTSELYEPPINHPHRTIWEAGQ